MCAIATAVVIAAAVHPRRGPVGRLLSVSPLCRLGLVSYGVYLWHWPIFVVLDPARVHLGGWPLFAIRVAVTLVIAAVSSRVVERPIRALAKPQRPVVTWRRVAVSLTTAVVLLAAVLVATAGPPAPAHVLVADPIPRPTRVVRVQQTRAVTSRVPGSSSSGTRLRCTPATKASRRS